MIGALGLIFFLNVKIESGLVIETYNDLAVIETEDGNCFAAIDDTIEQGDFVSVLFDTNGTTEREDDKILAIKKIEGVEL